MGLYMSLKFNGYKIRPRIGPKHNGLKIGPLRYV